MTRYKWLIPPLLLLCTNGLYAQGQPRNCNDVLKLAQDAFKNGDYDEANFILDDVEACDLYDKLYQQRRALRKKVNAAIKRQTVDLKNTLDKANENVARYYTSEAKQALEKDDSRLAYLLAKAALEKNNKNKEAQLLYDTILPYLSTHLYKNAEAIVWSPDSSIVVFFTDVKDNQGFLNIFSIEHSSIRTFARVSTENYSFLPNNKFFVFFTDVEKLETDDLHGTLNLLALDRNEPPRIFLKASFNDYSLSPGNNFFVYFTERAGFDAILNIVNLKNIKLSRKFSNAALSVAINYCFSSNDKYFAFFKRDELGAVNINLLDLDKNEPPQTIPGSESTGYEPCEFSIDNKFLFFDDSDPIDASAGTAYSWSLEKDELTQSFPDTTNTKTDINFQIISKLESEGKYGYHKLSSNGKFLAYFNDINLSKDNHTFVGNLNLLNSETNAIIGPYPNVRQGSCSFSKNSKHFAFVTHEYIGSSSFVTKETLNLLTLDTTQFLHRTFSPASFYNYEFSPDGQFLLFSTGSERNYKLISLEGNEFEKVFTNTRVDSFSSDGKYLFFISTESQNRESFNIYDLQRAELYLSIPNFIDSKYLFSSDRNLFAFYSISNDNTFTLNLFDSKTKQILKSFPTNFKDYLNYPYRDYILPKFSFDNSLLLFANDTGKRIFIWNIFSNKGLQQFDHINNVQLYATSKDNKWLLTLTKNGVLKIINLNIRPEERRSYYDKKEVLDFTKEEKAYYGIE